ncbi:unnamed protein product [Cuscuta campestris]|uniref:Ubiquitin-like protease family profile domain-containing protein n=1 Tax=Cuscuta campestris TaxID=132261 RepID=A0A484K486_9ASTE|nr:unnamed protein product [Cuscuta campestris]
MKSPDIANCHSSHPVRRRSARIAMAKEEAVKSAGDALSAEDELDDIPLMRRMEMVQIDNVVFSYVVAEVNFSQQLVISFELTLQLGGVPDCVPFSFVSFANAQAQTSLGSRCLCDVQKPDKGGLLDGRINTYCNVNEVARQITSKLTEDELKRFRTSAFGVILDVLDCPWISGQLLIHLVGSTVRPADGGGSKDVLKFQLLGREVVLTKAQFHLITGLKMGGLRGRMDNGACGRFASRYFYSSKSVKRRDISKAFISFNRDAEGTMPNDALKMALIYALANSFLGNQPSVNLPMCYLNLVDDIDEFNSYPWGDDVWSELVDHVYRCAVCIEKGGSSRPTFGGYMFALQVWAFETFLALEEAGMCEIGHGRANSIPRCLRWKISGKFNAAKVSEALFKSGKVVVKEVEPTAAEMLMKSVKELFQVRITSSVKGKRKLSLSATKRVRNVTEKQVNIRDALGKMRAEGLDDGAEKLAGVKKVECDSAKKVDNVVGRRGKKDCVTIKGCDHMNIVEEIKQIKEKQVVQDRKGSLMGGNDEVKVQEAVPSGAGNTHGVLKNGDDLELSFDVGGPSFDHLTQMPKEAAIGDEVAYDETGNVSLAEDHDDAKQGKCLDIPYTETQYDPHKLDRIDRETEGAIISLRNARSVKFVWFRVNGMSGSVGGCNVQGAQKVSMDDDDFDRIFIGSRLGSGVQEVKGGEDPVVAFSAPSNSNSACVEIDCPKRVHKSPERYTPLEAEQDKKRRKLERLERARQRHNCDKTGVCYGPFSKDPKEMPDLDEIEKVRSFLNEGFLKRHGRGNRTCRYTSKVENMSKDPIVLDGFTVDSKTWLYELFSNTEWLSSTGRQYELLQMYTKTTPYFLQRLYTHQEMVNVGKAKKEGVMDNLNLTSNHSVLLVLEVEGRTIRVYDSKGKRGKVCRSLNGYGQCVTELLPVLLDLLGVYGEHTDGPMGNRKFSINIIDRCPQQDDGCNCGMFMLKFAEYLMMDRHISEVHSRDMEAYRVKMTTELIVYSNERKEQAKDT